jgi:two-component system, cell cycle response regulator
MSDRFREGALRLGRLAVALPAVTALTLLVTGVGLFSLPGGKVGREAIYELALAEAAVFLTARAVLVREERFAWGLLAAGFASWAAADFYILALVPPGGLPPSPTIADLGYLSFYPCAFAALCLMGIRRVRDLERTIWLDGLIAGLAVAGCSIAFVHPAIDTISGSTVSVLTNAAYPVGDTVLLSLAVLVAAICGRRIDGSFALLIGALVVFAVGDSLYLVQSAKGTYGLGGVLDSSWAIAGAMMALGAWRARGPGRRRAGGAPLVLPAVFGLLSTGVLAFDHFGSIDHAAVVLVTAAVVVVVFRMVVFARRYVAALGTVNELARTDVLTGLPNRRAFLENFAEALAATEHGERWSLVLFDLNHFKAYNDTLGHPAGDALLAELAGRLSKAVRPNGTAYRLGGDEFCILVERHGDDDGVQRAAELALSVRGKGFHINSSNGGVLVPEEAQTETDALRLADERLYRHKQARPGSGERLLSDALLQAMAEHSPQFVQRHRNVAGLARALGEAQGLPEAELDATVRAAELHDIGKLAVPDEILTKPGPLTPGELQLIRTHTLVGERIIRVAASMREVAGLVRSSHERWDGGGYPDGLAGEDIPRGARIVTICDSFDAMLTERPYAAALTIEGAVAELRRERGGQFDPVLVDTLLELYAQGDLPLASKALLAA